MRPAGAPQTLSVPGHCPHPLDVLTHGFLPFSAAAALRRPLRERVAAAVGGVAPDIDTIWAWTASLDHALYPVAHRGFTHTLIGAPLIATLTWLLLHALGRRWRRLRGFEARRDILPALWIGALSHLVLDVLTITGVPAMWPLSDHRFRLDFYFYSVSPMFLVALVLWVPVLRRRATDRWVVRGGVVLLAVLLLSGAARAATYPDEAPPHARVTPTNWDWSWIVSQKNDTGVLVYESRFGRILDPIFLPERNATAARAAIEACLASPDATWWRWNAWALPVANATAREDGGWSIRIVDSARLYNEVRDPNSPAAKFFGGEDRRALRVDLAAEGDVTVEPRQRRSFWG
jgi:membrane-bound metal-dependent hydrolase YbcI (DUF457 family)